MEYIAENIEDFFDAVNNEEPVIKIIDAKLAKDIKREIKKGKEVVTINNTIIIMLLSAFTTWIFQRNRTGKPLFGSVEASDRAVKYGVALGGLLIPTPETLS